MSAWDHYWFGEVAAIRPYLLVKALLCMVAFDAWLVMVPTGGRYGAGGFDVAHFRWLDAVQPLPNPGLYVSLMLSVGMFALVSAFADAGRWSRALVALTYTYGWAMSFHDGYQHHYFLSLVLTLFVFFPRLRSRDLYSAGVPPSGRKRGRAKPAAAARRAVSSWAYALLAVNVGIVYAFTALAKLDPEWRAGEVLLRIAGPRLGSWTEGFASSPGLWKVLALSAFITECLLALGYFLAVRLDHLGQLLRVVAGLTFIVAVGFHLGIDLFVEGIGWFSYYMIVVACVYFLPASLLWAVGGALAGPALRLASMWSATSGAPAGGTRAGNIALTVAVATTAAVVAVAAGLSLDLPGAETLGVLAASVVAGATLLAVVLGFENRAMHYLLATLVAAVAMWGAIALSTVRFYYYGQVGMDMWRRGDNAAAAEAFDRANRYAPEAKRLERFLENR
jgi:hypothetical protein